MIEVIECTKAEEFIEKISPIGSYFNGAKIDTPWIFRGQGQDFPLIPSLFRKDKKSKDKLQSLTKRNIDNYEELLQSERDLLAHFFEIADRRGLILPDDSQKLRIHLEKLKAHDEMVKLSINEWRVKDEALSLIALAQHYGLPTRLLDWTYQSFTAAFFAGEDARNFVSNPVASNYLIVWAFYFPALGRQDGSSRMFDPISIVTAPAASNINLRAQQGVFTSLNFFYAQEEIPDKSASSDEIQQAFYECEMPGRSLVSKGAYPSLDKLFEAHSTRIELHRDLEPRFDLIRSSRFIKFTLPLSESSRLLYLLAKFDITPSVVYPGYHSIVDDLKLRNIWE